MQFKIIRPITVGILATALSAIGARAEEIKKLDASIYNNLENYPNENLKNTPGHEGLACSHQPDLGVLLTVAVTAKADVAGALQKAGIRNGIACVIGSEQADTALGLAKDGKFLVLVLDADAGNVTKLQQQAAAAGVLGRSLYVEEGTIDRIPFADNYVDVLIVGDAGPAARQEVLRVLTPIHGRAIIGHQTMEKPELSGSDWWAHKRHLPDNNPVSHDTVFQFPPITQYRAQPMNDSGQGTGLSAGGVKFEMYDWTMGKIGQTGLSGRLLARNVYNGRILWDRIAPQNILPSAPIMVATNDSLWIASGSAGEALRFNALTGEPMPAVAVGDAAQRIKWLAIQDGRLYALLGGKATFKQPFSFYVPQPQSRWENRELFGNELVAWDLRANRAVWRHKEDNPIDDTNVAVSGGRVFFYSDEKRLVCLDAATGNEIWSNSGNDWLAKLKRPNKPHQVFVANTPHMLVADNLLCFGVAEGGLTLSFDARTGNFLSAANTGVKTMIVDGKLISGVSVIDPLTGERMQDQNLLSPAGTAWCGLATYCKGTGVLGHSTLGLKAACAEGAWVAGGILHYSPTVCNCDTLPGAAGFASGAALLERAEKSPEHPLVKGPAFGAVVARSAVVGDWPQYRGSARRQGSSAAKVADQSASVAWQFTPDKPFSYSRNYNAYTLSFDDRPAPPIVADGKVFAAASDGTVSALALADGKRLWTLFTGGAVMTAPAWDGGRLFVPSGDGWLYVVDASNGALAWKRRIAPIERRICVFDKLISTWPVAAVLVDGGVVYTTAGLMHTDGVVSMALDAATGDIRWSTFAPPSRESFEGSHQNPDRPVYGAGGNLAKVGHRIWANGHFSPPLVLDAASGKDTRYDRIAQLVRKSSYYDFRNRVYSQGQEIIVLGDDTLLVGGGPLWMEQQIREGKRGRTSFRIYLLDKEGDWLSDRLPMQALRFGRVAPACDDGMFVFAGPPPWKPAKGGKELPDQDSGTADENVVLQTNVEQATLGLNAWDRAAFLSDAENLQTQSPFDEEAMKQRPGQIIFKRRVETQRPLAHNKAAWNRADLDVSAIALAPNAVIAAHAKGFETLKFSERAEPRGATIRYDGWQLSAFDRQKGQPLWSVPLPAEPLLNGLAIAADGSVIVMLRDGSVACVR